MEYVPDSGRVTEPGFGSICKLNALQNARITDVQGHLTVKGRDTCSEAGDSYRRVICITRSREVRKNDEHGPDDD